jgi:hypothetical protein
MSEATIISDHPDFIAYLLTGAVAILQFFGYRELKRIDEQFKKGSERMDRICNELCGGEGIVGLKTKFAVLENEHQRCPYCHPIHEHRRDHESAPHPHRRKVDDE